MKLSSTISKHFFAGIIAGVLGLLIVIPLRAQSYWNGGSGNWSGTNNWVASPPATNAPSYVSPPNSSAANAKITTGNSTVTVDENFTVGELTVGSTDTVSINDGQSLTVTSVSGFTGAGTISNSGSINLNSTGDPTGLYISGNVTLSGGGSVNLTGGALLGTFNEPATQAIGTFENVDNTIEGGGPVLTNASPYLAPIASFTNDANGTINANVSSGTLEFNAASVTNYGTVEATNGGTLEVTSNASVSGFGQVPLNFYNNNGTIKAQANSTINLGTVPDNITIGGGTIQAQDGATIYLGQAVPASPPTGYLGSLVSLSGATLSTSGNGQIVGSGSIGWQSVTNEGNFVVTDASSLTLSGTNTNSGTIILNSTGQTTVLAPDVYGSAILQGGGTVNLTGGALVGAFNDPATSAAGTFENVDNTIEGGGTVNASASPYLAAIASFTNDANGTVNANVSGGTLEVNAAIVSNSGTMEATSGGTLEITSNVAVYGNSSWPLFFNSYDGTIKAQANSTINLGAVLNNITIGGGTVQAQDGATIYLGQAVPASPPTGYIGSLVSLSGATLSTSGNGQIVGSGSIGWQSVTNEGNFVVTDASYLTLSGTNTNSGTITLNSMGRTTVLAPGYSDGAILQGGGTVNLTGGALLGTFNDPATQATGTFENVDNTIEGGGTVNASASPYLASIASFTNDANGTVNANVSGGTLEVNAASVTNYGTVEATNGGTLEVASTVPVAGFGLWSLNFYSNNGTIKAQANSTINLGAVLDNISIGGGIVQSQGGATIYLGQAIPSSPTPDYGESLVNLENTALSTSGTGQIVGSGEIGWQGVTNQGNFVVTDASSLSMSGTNTNSGTITLESAGRSTLLAAGGNGILQGGGTVNMTGGASVGNFGTQATGTLENVDNTIEGGGPAVANPPSYLAPIESFANDVNGTINANVSGGMLLVNATLLGNFGTVEATNGGTLEVNGGMTNAGTISADPASTVRIEQGLASNSGTISLNGGTFDNNSYALDNTGQINGYGTVSTGGLTNDGSMSLTGGTTTVNGNVTNSAGKAISIAQSTVTFTGNVVNNGTLTTTGATATFSGSFTNNAAFITDPSTLNFTNLTIGPSGYVQAGSGDIFNVSGNVTDNSTSAMFNISQATLSFVGTGNHILNAVGENFAIGTLDLAAGASLTFDFSAGTSIYLGNFDLLGGAAQLADVTDTGGGNVYYNPNLPGNAYLNDQNYSLPGGGFLEAGTEAAPEPSTWAMLLGGLGLLAFWHLRCHAPKH